LFLLSALLSALAWLALAVLAGSAGVVAVAAGLGLVHAVFRTHLRGNGVRLSESQLPELHLLCQSVAERLNISPLPEVYLLKSFGMSETLALSLLSRRCVVLDAALLADCTDPRQREFLIAHELARVSAGHFAWSTFLLPVHLMPWLGAAYRHAGERTGDRAGLQVVRAIEPALRTLALMSLGPRLSERVNPRALLAQSDDAGGAWARPLCVRVAALQQHAEPGSVRPRAHSWTRIVLPVGLCLAGLGVVAFPRLNRDSLDQVTALLADTRQGDRSMPRTSVRHRGPSEHRAETAPPRTEQPEDDGPWVLPWRMDEVPAGECSKPL
jgi:hypothetical protein